MTDTTSSSTPAATSEARDPVPVSRTLTVVVPVLDDADSLGALFSRFEGVEQTLRNQGITLAYVFVDDGSRDATFAELLQWKQRKPSIVIVKLSRNFGAVAASNAGLQHVRGDAFTIFSADLQDPPELIPSMAELWLAGSKFVICQRERKRADPLPTRLCAWFYYRLVRWLVIDRFPDTGFDIFLLDAHYLGYLRSPGKNINRSLYAYWLGLSPAVITYERPPRHSGRSHWTFSRKLKLFVDSLLGFGTRPIRLVILVGLGVATLSFCYGGLIIIGAVRGRVVVPGYASLAVMMSMMFGLVFFLLGIMAEYLWRVLEEVNQRPEAVVEAVVE